MWKITLEIQQKKKKGKGGRSKIQQRKHMSHCTVRVCGGNGWGFGGLWDENAGKTGGFDRRQRHESGK